VRFQSHQELARAVRHAAPQPQVAPAPLVRLIAGLLDLAPAIGVFVPCVEKAPWAAPTWFALWLGLGIVFLGASPGQWLMRLRVRTRSDGDVPPLRAAVRAVLQWGWAAAVAVGYSLITHGVDTTASVLVIVGVAWAAVVLLGALPAALRKPTLVDRLTRTRVQVDVR
jgi:hypothetical protein